MFSLARRVSNSTSESVSLIALAVRLTAALDTCNSSSGNGKSPGCLQQAPGAIHFSFPLYSPLIRQITRAHVVSLCLHEGEQIGIQDFCIHR